MNNGFSFSKTLIYFFTFLFIFIILMSCIFIPLVPSINTNFTEDNLFVGSSGYVWPIPGYTNITSFFGKRTSPTAGASSFHKGVDIGAPEGTSLIAMCDGEITFASFLGGGRLYYYSFFSYL